jgi:hypothetical protein
MLFSSKNKFYIQLIDGKIAEVSKLSIISTESFRDTLQEINVEIEKTEYQTLSFSMGYKTQPLFRHLVDRLLKIIDLQASDLDVDSLFTLLFPHSLPDGRYERQGLLAKFLLGEIQGGSHVDAESVDHYAKLIGDLWASTSDLKQVMIALSEFSYEDLAEVLKHKREALKPAEDKLKEKSIEKAKVEFEKLKNINKDFKLEKLDELDFSQL